MNTSPTSIESRLTEALNARAEQLQPTDLTPAHVPATVAPLRRRLQVGGALAAAAAVAAAAVVAVSVLNDDGDSGTSPAPQPTISDTSNPTPAPTTPVTPPAATDLSGLLPQDPTEYVEPGGTIPLRDGAQGVVRDGRLEISGPDLSLRSDLEGFDPTSSLDVVQVPLGQVGDGYLVSQTLGGESFQQKLYVVADGGALTEVQAPRDVPFGTSYTEGFPDGYITWTTGDGSNLYTRVQVGDPADRRFDVYRWEVTGPGEGGGPENPERTLVPTEVGTACFDLQTDTVTAC